MSPPGAGWRDIVLEFAYPLAFLALPIPLLSWWLLPPRREQVSAIRVPFFDRIVAASGTEPRAGAVIVRRHFLEIAVATLVWSGIVTGLAKPEWVGEPIVRTEAARDIMLAIDLSGSMDYRDFPGGDGEKLSRFESVRRVVNDFVAERKTDRIGLIVFGDRAYLQLPFTRDLNVAADLIGLMEVGMAGPRTALGDAIGLAIRAFQSSQVKDRVLILLTDGNDTASAMTPINAADIASLNGVEIHTIGIGNESASGEDRVDFDTLAAVAGRTGGRFFNVRDEGALAGVYQEIDRATTAAVRTESWRPRTALVHWPASLVFLILALAAGRLLVRRRATRATAA